MYPSPEQVAVLLREGPFCTKSLELASYLVQVLWVRLQYIEYLGLPIATIAAIRKFILVEQAVRGGRIQLRTI